MPDNATVFGSIDNFQKGGVQIIDDDPKNYVFSNMFEVASRSRPYERVAVGKNFEYVIECARAEGASPWYAAGHDEFAVCMDGKVEIHLVKLDDPRRVVPAGSDGAHRLAGLPDGRKMGRIRLGRGHMALLPAGAAYRFEAASPCTLMIQSIQGPETIERWAAICQTK
jgi:hypothetical protein